MLSMARIPPLRYKLVYLLTLIYLAAVAGIGMRIYRDFGAPWDEPAEIERGIANYRFILKHDPILLNRPDRIYGPLFEIFLVRFQSKGDAQQVYLSRHLITFLTFFSGCLAFYLLNWRLFRKAWMALAGQVFLTISPRIFGSAFFNEKDIPFMVFFIYALVTMLWYLDKPNAVRGLVHGIFTGALLALRLPGLVIPLLTLTGLILEVVNRRVTLRRGGLSFGLYSLSGAAGMVLFWPALWADPIGGFIASIKEMSHYPHDAPMLYLGQRISSTNLPWHYLPVWIAVTTPILYLLLFFLGLGVILYRLSGKIGKKLDRRGRDELLILGSMLIPLLTVIIIKSVVYDSWRQMYFIYPSFVLIALFGLEWGWSRLAKRFSRPLTVAFIVGVLLLGLLPPLTWMIHNHPYEYVYFNRLAGPNLGAAQQLFMTDYWGLAYRPGLEYLVKTDKSQVIDVFLETEGGYAAIEMLPPDDARRIRVVNKPEEARYFIGNYYLLPGVYAYHDEIFTVQVDGAKLLSIYDLNAQRSK